MDFPFPRTGSSHGLCERDAKGSGAVHDRDADLDFRNLPVEVPRHEALPHKLRIVRRRLDATLAEVAVNRPGFTGG